MSELEKQAYELCLAIEQLPASEYQTKLSIMASNLLRDIKTQTTVVKCGECGRDCELICTHCYPIS